MKRKFGMILIAAICFIIQNTVLKELPFGNISPNLLLMITAAFGFIGGRKEGMFMGFFCGLFTDVFFGNLLGYYTFLYTSIGYANGFFHAVFYDSDIRQPMMLIALSDLGYGLIQYFFQFLLRGKFEFGFYFINIIFPEVLYSIVLTLLFYKFFLKISKKLDRLDAGSEDDFVG